MQTDGNETLEAFEYEVSAFRECVACTPGSARGTRVFGHVAVGGLGIYTRTTARHEHKPPNPVRSNVRACVFERIGACMRACVTPPGVCVAKPTQTRAALLAHKL